MVTDTALYRETAFTVAVPSASVMVGRLGSYLNDLVYSADYEKLDVSDTHNQLDCPWMYIRRHFSVSYIKHKKFLCFKSYFKRLLCNYEFNDLKLLSFNPVLSPLPAFLPDYNDL